jgi:hypothetical protein
VTVENHIPSSKHDLAAVERARLRGFPALDHDIGTLLTWVQDANWPVAPVVADLLVTAGPAIVPEVRKILRSDDGMWKYWVIQLVVARLPDALISRIVADLEQLRQHPTQDDKNCEVDRAAATLLQHR